MDDQKPQEKLKKKGKKWPWILGAFVLLIIIFASVGDEENQNSNQTQSVENENVNSASVVEENSNINSDAESVTNESVETEENNKVSRNEIMDLFADFSFSQGNPINGNENYIGKSNNNLSMIQLIGLEDSLNEISIANTMGPDSVDQMDILNTYLDQMTNKLTPNIDSGFPKFELTNATTTSDGFQVEYLYTEYGSSAPGVYSEVYTFKAI